VRTSIFKARSDAQVCGVDGNFARLRFSLGAGEGVK